jgi:hypothetical protein
LDGRTWRVKSLPHQLQHLTSLVKLKIFHFDGEEFDEALPDWLANLSSLQELTICYCKNLKYLPSSTAMQRFSKLTRLQIWRCPLLQQNCFKGSGSEWHKISHFPYINIVSWISQFCLLSIIFIFILNLIASVISFFLFHCID